MLVNWRAFCSDQMTVESPLSLTTVVMIVIA